MYQSIFIPLSSNGNQLPALTFAASLAQAFEANAECIFASKSIRLLEKEQKDKVMEIYLNKGFVASSELADKLYQEHFSKRVKQVEDWFNLNKNKLPSGKLLHWKESLDLFGETAEQLRNECSFHDITVASYDFSVSLQDELITGALFSSGKPLVLVRNFEQEKDLSDCTVILAWKFTPQSLRAQFMSLPILKKVGKVIVVSVEEDKNEVPERELSKLVSYLKKHNNNVEFNIINNAKNPAEALESYYSEVKADLLIMGAYSHSRLQEMVLGGFTRFFIDSKKCNLLLAH
jgi:nucleotide-binding universal stress UspA family protein